MESWSPLAPEERFRLAEGEAVGWSWVLEAWRQPDRDGQEQVFVGLRPPDAIAARIHRVNLEFKSVDAVFESSEDGSASVLYGAVIDDLEAVLVTAPGGEAQRAEIVEAPGVGRFFWVAFDHVVERAGITVEPESVEPRPFPFAVNMRAEQLRREAEGVIVGGGASPAGTRWRLRVWQQDPDRIQVYIERFLDEAGRWFGIGGYGGGYRAADQLVKFSMAGRGQSSSEQHLVGELKPDVAAVRVRLDDGDEIDAAVLRTDAFDDDYWVAFAAPEAEVRAVVAIDKDGSVIGEQARTDDELRAIREAHERMAQLRRNRGL